jgi:hypothetical protein
VTVKFVALSTLPPSVTTLILPVVAPLGTVTFTLVAVSWVMVAAVPLNVTLVAPSRFVPVMVTAVPGGPVDGLKPVIVGGDDPVSIKVRVAK